MAIFKLVYLLIATVGVLMGQTLVWLHWPEVQARVPPLSELPAWCGALAFLAVYMLIVGVVVASGDSE